MEMGPGFEFEAETKVTFEAFRKFFNCIVSRGSRRGLLIKAAPYIFLTGLFFCFLDMIIFKEDSLGPLLLIIVLLMGVFMLLLYIVPPRAYYNANEEEFSLPYKYKFTEKGVTVTRDGEIIETFFEYSAMRMIIETKTSFYLGCRNKFYIVEKSDMDESDAFLLSITLKDENRKYYRKIRE